MARAIGESNPTLIEELLKLANTLYINDHLDLAINVLSEFTKRRTSVLGCLDEMVV